MEISTLYLNWYTIYDIDTQLFRVLTYRFGCHRLEDPGISDIENIVVLAPTELMARLLLLDLGYGIIFTYNITRRHD
jgi:hypothetical protein